LGEQLNAQKPAHLQAVPYLPEPHAAWVNALEKEWLQRYGAK
jgi:putative thiamine transport system substrate-binding protein